MFEHPRQCDQNPQRLPCAVADQGHLGEQLAVAGPDQPADAAPVRRRPRTARQRLSDELLSCGPTCRARVSLTRMISPALFTRSSPLSDSSNTRRKRSSLARNALSALRIAVCSATRPRANRRANTA